MRGAGPPWRAALCRRFHQITCSHGRHAAHLRPGPRVVHAPPRIFPGRRPPARAGRPPPPSPIAAQAEGDRDPPRPAARSSRGPGSPRCSAADSSIFPSMAATELQGHRRKASPDFMTCALVPMHPSGAPMIVADAPGDRPQVALQAEIFPHELMLQQGGAKDPREQRRLPLPFLGVERSRPGRRSRRPEKDHGPAGNPVGAAAWTAAAAVAASGSARTRSSAGPGTWRPGERLAHARDLHDFHRRATPGRPRPATSGRGSPGTGAAGKAGQLSSVATQTGFSRQSRLRPGRNPARRSKRHLRRQVLCFIFSPLENPPSSRTMR